MGKAIYFSFLFTALMLTVPGFAQKKYWVGNGGSTSWKDPSNWSLSSGGPGGAAVPASTDTVYFNSGGPGGCTMDTAVSIDGIVLESSYTDTLHQGGFFVNIGGSGLTLEGGTFGGGTSMLVISGPSTLTGGVFILPSDTVEFRSTLSVTGGSFIHNGGTSRLRASCTINKNLVFHNLDLSPASSSGSFTFTVDSAITVVNELRFTGNSGQQIFLNSGRVDLKGDLVNNQANTAVGNTEIYFNGTGLQHVSCHSAGRLSRLIIDKPADTLVISSSVNVNGGWTYLQGVIDDSTYSPVVHFTAAQTISGNHALRKVSLGAAGGGPVTITVNAGDTLTVTDSLHYPLSIHMITLSGVIDLKGHLFTENLNAGFLSTSGTILFSGAGNQDIRATGTGRIPGIKVEKPSGSVIVHDDIIIHGSWNVPDDNVDVTTHSVKVTFWVHIWNATITGKPDFYDLAFTASNNSRIVSISDTITVHHELEFYGSAGPQLNDGTIRALGDIDAGIMNGNMAGSGSIVICGTGAQTLTGNPLPGRAYFCHLYVDKPADTLFIKETVSVGNSFHYVSGVLDAVTFQPTFYLADQLFKHVYGSFTVWNLTYSWSFFRTIGVHDTITVMNDFRWSGTNRPRNGSGASVINLKGNVFNTNTSGLAADGNLELRVNGAGNQTWYGNPAPGTGRINKLVIDKPSDTLFVTDYVTLENSLKYEQGDVDAVTGNSTFEFAGNDTIWADGMEFNNLHVIAGHTILGSDLAVRGILKTETGATLSAMASQLRVKDEFIVLGTFNRGTSTLQLDGDQAGQLNSASGVLEFYNLQVRKEGGAGIDLATRVEIDGTLTLDSGYVNTTAEFPLVIRDNATVSGGSALSFVQGPVIKYGDDAFLFPVGTAGDYRPLSVPAPALSDTITVVYKNDPPPSALETDEPVKVSPCGYWELSALHNDLLPELGWESDWCDYTEPGEMTVVAFDGETWNDLGSSLVNGSGTSGSIIAGSLITRHDYEKPVPITIGSRTISYAKLLRKPDGGYYRSNGRKLYFKYDEEYYVSKDLQYAVYDKSHTLLSTLPVLPVKIGDNRYILELQQVSGMVPGFYILEVTNDKSEKRYLRFKYESGGFTIE